MGSGTSLAQHSADCIMMNDNLMTLIDAFDIARQTMRVVKQNIIWAVCYNIVALPLAATGVLVPWMAALGMSASWRYLPLSLLLMDKELSCGDFVWRFCIIGACR